ncbi:MAG: hypothetical protein GF315_05815 [candidate division Zixibacteria bacterium]|nr:hypothetical protein [candidate division Zixibacteria bacterium]
MTNNASNHKEYKASVENHTNSDFESKWLDYAWSVLNCSNKQRCYDAGAAKPHPDRNDGNDLCWPGYIGRNYEPGEGILCVGAVHKELSLDALKKDAFIRRNNEDFVNSARQWLQEGRSPGADQAYLSTVRKVYERALPTWSRYRSHFRMLIEDYLCMDIAQIAWVNLAKCRVPVDQGTKRRAAQADLTCLCQNEGPAMSNLIEALRPVAVLVAGLKAGQDSDIVPSWDGPNWSPLVFSWQGQFGHDRHNTDPKRRSLKEWAPEMVAEIKAALGN